MKQLLVVSGCAALVAAIAWGVSDVQGQIQEDAPDGVEVYTRGPIHEGFAQPVSVEPEPGPVIAKAPPANVPEIPAELKPEGDNVVWIPGYWAWDLDLKDFLWVSGIWRDVPPDRQWVSGYWRELDQGWQWVPGYWIAAGQTEIEVLPQPPEPIQEAVPPAPDAEAVYVPGTWVYVETHYRWRPGYFVRYRPGWTWVPASYTWTPAGYVFVDGYWDRDLHRRGLLFAPVHFNVALFNRPGWSYRPRYAVFSDIVLGSLFVRSGGWSHYYFGDYYDRRYAPLGFTAWIDFRQRGRFHDPLFSYYGWQYRNRPNWESELRASYVARQKGTLAAPPQTLTQQIKLRQTNQNAVQVVAPVQTFKTGDTNIQLTNVTNVELKQAQQNATAIQTLRTERSKGEAGVKGQGAIKGGGKAGIVKLNLPKTTARAQTTKGKTTDAGPPPNPQIPQPRDKGAVDTPMQKGKDIDTPKQKGKDIDVPKQKGKDVDVPRQKGKDVDAPKQKGKDVDVPKQKGKDLDVPKQKGKDVDVPKQKGKDVDVPKQKGKDVDVPKQKGKDLDVPKVQPKPEPKQKPEAPKVQPEPAPKAQPKPEVPKAQPKPEPKPKDPDKKDKDKDNAQVSQRGVIQAPVREFDTPWRRSIADSPAARM